MGSACGGCSSHVNDPQLVDEENEPLDFPYEPQPRPAISGGRYPRRVSVKLTGVSQPLSAVVEEDSSSGSLTAPAMALGFEEVEQKPDVHSRQISALDYFQRKQKSKKRLVIERHKKKALGKLEATKTDSDSELDVLKMDGELLESDAIPMSTSAVPRSDESLFSVATAVSSDEYYTKDLHSESKDTRADHCRGVTDFIDAELFTAKTPLVGISGVKHMLSSDEIDEDAIRRGSFFGHMTKKKPLVHYSSDDEKDADSSPTPAWMFSSGTDGRDSRSRMSNDFVLEDVATDSKCAPYKEIIVWSKKSK